MYLQKALRVRNVIELAPWLCGEDGKPHHFAIRGPLDAYRMLDVYACLLPALTSCISFLFSQPNRGTKRPRDDEEEELKTRRKQTGPRERGRYREDEATAAEDADDDKKRLLQIIDRDGEEEEEEVVSQSWAGAHRVALRHSEDRVLPESPSLLCKMGLRNPASEH